MLRKLSAIGIVALAALLFYRGVYVRWRCNVVEARVAASTAAAWEDVTYNARLRAERNIEQLRHCLDAVPHDVNLQMLAAANYRLLGRLAVARTVYERALRYERRRDLYHNLALVQLQMGDRAQAFSNFIAAGEFGGTHWVAEIPDAEMRTDVYRTLGHYSAEAAARHGYSGGHERIVNGRFELTREPAPVGPGQWLTPAVGWLLASDGAEAEAKLVPSTRRPGGNALHVTTFARDGGIRQTWSPARRAPFVVTSAWVYVTRGRVYLGSGDGSPPLANARSTSRGRWELLRGTSVTCPARLTIVAADGKDGADFIVDEVSAKAVPGPPCD